MAASHYRPGDDAEKIRGLTRYISCGRVTKRPIFEFISHIFDRAMRSWFFLSPMITPLASFNPASIGLGSRRNALRSREIPLHIRHRIRHLPLAASATLAQARAVADAAVTLRALRRRVMTENQWSLRDLYRTLDLPGKNPLRDAQNALDVAVRAAYGMKAKADPLAFLLALNQGSGGTGGGGRKRDGAGVAAVRGGCGIVCYR